MIIDSDSKCTVCGTMRGNRDPITGKPWRSKKGWCQPCCRRGGKINEIKPCVECGTLGGAPNNKPRKDGTVSDRPMRLHDRCRNCYNRGQRRQRKDCSRVVGAGTYTLDRKHKAAVIEQSETAIEQEVLAIKPRPKPAPKPDNESDEARESRVRIQRCIQEYRAAERKWKAIKAYKLDAVKKTDSVLLSA